MIATIIDQAMERILRVTKFRGGLTVTLAAARAFVETAKVEGIDGALVKHGRGFADFAGRLAEECRKIGTEDGGLIAGEGAAMGAPRGPHALGDLGVRELREVAKGLKIKGYYTMKREELLLAIPAAQEPETTTATMEAHVEDAPSSEDE